MDYYNVSMNDPEIGIIILILLIFFIIVILIFIKKINK